MSITEKIAELEAEMAKTQKNKATEHHLGLVRAKIAKLKRDLMVPRKGTGGGGGGFDVRKAGNSTVVFIGLPSVGKSTLFNALTGAKSKIAAYAFTTLTCIPGIMHYKGAQIQLLDLPGIISGAKTGKGRGREVLAVARNADLVLLMIDVFDPFIVDKLREELSGIGIRLDKEKPNIHVHQTEKGGIDIVYSVKVTHLNDRIIRDILNEYGMFSANVNVREDATVDDFIDLIVGNRKYVPSIVVLNKVDLVKPDFLKKITFDYIPVSASGNKNIEELKEEIYRKLKLMRVYTRSRFDGTDAEPLMMREGSSVADVCEKIHRDLKSLFKYVQVWGKSAKYPGQKLGLDHVLKDQDTVFIHKK